MEHEIRLPLTAAQRALWFAQQLCPDDPLFLIHQYVEITGPLDPQRFQAAVHATVAEMDALRVRIVDGPDGPSQVVLAEPDWSPTAVDLSGEPDPEAAARALMAADVARPPALLGGPLVALQLMRIGPDRHFWYRRGNHIVYDGYSAMMVIRRVAEHYNAAEAGQPTPVGSAPGPLRELVAADAAYAGSAQHEQDRAFWRAHLAGAEPVPGLPPGIPSRVVSHDGLLDPVRDEALAGATERLGSTWARLVIGAAAAYRYRVTGRPDVALGLTVAARTDAVSRRVPGVVSNIVALRTRITPDLTLGAAAAAVTAELGRILPHQRFRVEELRRQVGLRQRAFGPVINVAPFFQQVHFGGSPAIVRLLGRGPFEDMSIFVTREEEGGSTRVHIDADGDLYSPADLAEHHAAFLDALGAAADAHAPVSAPSTVPSGSHHA